LLGTASNDRFWNSGRINAVNAINEWEGCPDNAVGREVGDGRIVYMRTYRWYVDRDILSLLQI